MEERDNGTIFLMYIEIYELLLLLVSREIRYKLFPCNEIVKFTL